MKKPIVLIAAILAVVGLCAAVAVANETIKVPTSVSIHADNFPVPSDVVASGGTTATFSGKLTAKKGCKKHRKVVLRKARPIPPGSFPGVRGFDRTNNRGRYTIKKFFRDRRVGYFVRATKKIVHNDGEKIVCKRGQSDTDWNY